jgi:DNA-binding Xre family transcriptional regulator
MMVQFNFEKFMLDKRVTEKELAREMGKTYPAIMEMKKRRSIKLTFLKKLEKKYDRLDNYLGVGNEN